MPPGSSRSFNVSFFSGLPVPTSSRARRRATSASSAGGTTSSTSPRRRARWASTVLPVRTRSSAGAMPIRRGRRCVPPPAGITPSCTSGWPRRVFEWSVAIRYEQASASSLPPPRHAPWIAATTGFPRWVFSRSRPSKAAWAARMASVPVSGVSSANHLMFAPARKSGFADVITTAVMAESFSRRSRTVRKSSMRDGSSVLSSSSARSITTVATPSETSRRKCSKVSVWDMSALQDDCGSQPAGGALGDEGGTCITTDQFVGHRQQLAGAGGAERMAEADRSAIEVQLLVGNLTDGLLPAQVLAGELRRGECPADSQDLGGESLVDVDHVDLVESHPRSVESHRSRQGRADQELPPGVYRRGRIRADERLGLVAESAGCLLLHEDQGSGAVGERRRVAGRDGAVATVEGGLQ